MNSPIVILDFGSQYTQLIARRTRELGVYSEIEPYTISISQLKNKNPKAIILSGSPFSAGLKKSPKIEQEILELNIPILAICYGMQLISHLNEGKLNSQKSREYGRAFVEIENNSSLFEGFDKKQKIQAWMSHGDSVEHAPEGAQVLARSEKCLAAIQYKNIYAVQFHPEVAHTEKGEWLFRNFLFKIAKIQPVWKMQNFLDVKTQEIRERVGNQEIMGGISGGVDSTILAVFLGKIFKDQFKPILIDTGLLRLNEASEVKKFLNEIGVPLKVIDASKLFLSRLKNISSPEQKRKIIGKTFVEVFDKECKKLKKVKFLAQGTLYPDVIESVSVKGPSHTIKTHHNVGGLPKKMKLGLIEPFRELFKDEVRVLGKELGIPNNLIDRHPFPGPGLAVRILGKIEPKAIRLLQKADYIFIEELKHYDLYNKIWQAFSVFLPIKSVGVMGDSRTYENVICLRAVTSQDGMTADWFAFEKEFLSRVSNRIINEVPGVNRVVYDISSKPPATIEWE